MHCHLVEIELRGGPLERFSYNWFVSVGNLVNVKVMQYHYIDVEH